MLKRPQLIAEDSQKLFISWATSILGASFFQKDGKMSPNVGSVNRKTTDKIVKFCFKCSVQDKCETCEKRFNMDRGSEDTSPISTYYQLDPKSKEGKEKFTLFGQKIIVIYGCIYQQ